METAFEVRPAVPGEVGVIRQFIRELAEYERLLDAATASEAELAATLFGPQPRARVLLALAEGEAVGCAIYFFNYSTFLGRPGLYIEDIYVRPAWRHRGAGKRLFAALGKVARAEGCGRMEWSVLTWNAPSIAFYERLGAERLEEWRTYRLDAAGIAALPGRLAGGPSRPPA